MPQKLKFLVDESLEYSIVLFLRKQSYDVVAVAEEFPSIRDKEILEKANREDRVIITNDKDFGDLIFLNKLPHKGVILFRFRSEEIKTKIKVFESFLKTYSAKLLDKFAVIDEVKVRIRTTR